MNVPVESPAFVNKRPPKIVFEERKPIEVKEDKETNTDVLALEDREILTEPYIVEPEKIIERVIEYVPSPPKEANDFST